MIIYITIYIYNWVNVLTYPSGICYIAMESHVQFSLMMYLYMVIFHSWLLNYKRVRGYI